MRQRKGMGIGLGKGYKNMIVTDPIVHSLSAKGIKKKRRLFNNPYKKDIYNFGKLPTETKRGAIRDIARKVTEGVGWAVEWEKEHLPKQKVWVKKEFNQAKELAKQGVSSIKRGMKKRQLERDFKKFQEEDMNDVRNELDTDDDGDQDISIKELAKTNREIEKQLQTIDLDNDGVPDHHEDGIVYSGDLPDAPKPKGAGFPLPSVDPKRDYGDKGSIFKKGVSFVREKGEQAIDIGRQQIEKRQLQKDMIGHMSDKELREKAILVGKPALGKYNVFEKEIIKREQNKIRLQNIIDEAQSGEIEQKKSVNLGFLNPIGTLSKPKERDKELMRNDDVEKPKTDYFGFLNPIKTLTNKGEN